MKCKHYKEEGYTYQLREEKLMLCGDCELSLREIFKE